MSVFRINLATLPTGTSRLEVEASAAAVGLSETEWPEPVRASLSLDKAGDQVTLRGDVRATARLECVRCLRAFDLGVEAPLMVHADRAGTGRRADEDELERDDYMMFHDGRQLDLGERVRESLLLEIPISPRCAEDCRGLCPRCGGDRNQGACDCAAST